MTRRPPGLGLAFSAAVALTAAGQQPQFRAGVDVTRLEVTVLDKRTRQPITGLTADDFVIKVNGDPQPVVSLAEVTVPGVSLSAAAAFAEAAEDVRTNDVPSPRVFVLIMNDAAGGRSPYYRKTGKAIAHRFVDLLGPDDLAAVVFVRDNRQAQDLTQDRTLLRQAIEYYNPMGAPLKPGAVLRRTLEFLAAVPGYRRAVIFVSPMARVEFDDPHDDIDTFRELSDISAGARLSPIPVYTFSAHGLHPPTAQDIARGHGAFSIYDSHVESLRTIANLTGGRAIVNTNVPADHAPAVFEELGTYYLLAYQQAYPPDGRLRRLDVQVTRPDTMVIASRMVRAAPTPRPESEPGPVRRRSAPSGLIEALESPLPTGAVALRLATLPLAVGRTREQAVALTLGLPPVDDADRFQVRLVVYDGEGIRRFAEQAHTIDIARGTGGEATEVTMRLALRPGRYNIRLAAERASDGTAGSVHATVVVPDFARDRLSLSGVAIGRGEGRRIVGRGELGDLLPFAPTAVRTFDRTDQVGALLRVHQPARRLQAVTLDTEILDATGIAVVMHTRTLDPSAFDDGAAEHRFEVPLARLEPGDYLLRFAAAAGDARVQRDVPFTVR